MGGRGRTDAGRVRRVEPGAGEHGPVAACPDLPGRRVPARPGRGPDPGAGTGTGWDLHEYRYSGLTHLGEQGASLLMLPAKSRHRKADNVRQYFKPSPEAIAELLAPGDARR